MLLSTLPVGSRIHNRYEVLGHLGGGANGQVYEVQDHYQGHVAALKMLDPSKPPPGGWFVEAEFLTQLRGEYILPILNADNEAGVPFIVTEVMPNGSTADHIPPGIGVAIDQAATWVQQACVGISRILDQRVLHRDIKPANLFLDSHHSVLVGDFGLVCPMDASGNGTAYGSAETLAPEVVTSSVTNARTEVYSLGATLYELIAGHWLNPAVEAMAASGTPAAQIYAAVAAHTPTPIGNVAPHVPQGLRTIIMTAVDPDPARRYPNPAVFAAALGGRTKPARKWIRTAPCVGHTMCFVGTRIGANDYQLCAVPTGVRGRHELQTRHSSSGRKINPWPVVTPGQFASGLRSRISALT
jgi:serine/threonine protein kinase